MKIRKIDEEFEDVEMETDEEFQESADIEQQMARDDARESVDTTFEEFSISPIELHATTTQRRVSDVRSKLDRALSRQGGLFEGGSSS